MVLQLVSRGARIAYAHIAEVDSVPSPSLPLYRYDREVVGTANGFAAGWGNAGAGVTYFVMPAVFDSLVRDRGHTPHVAWRIAFIVPTILLLCAAAGAFFLCEDIPLGAWKDRHNATAQAVAENTGDNKISTTSSSDSVGKPFGEKGAAGNNHTIEDTDYESNNRAAGAPRMEVVQKPSLRTAVPLILTWQTLMLALPYTCSFGGELAVNSILSSWYLQHFAHLGWTQTHSGQVAAIFGLLNVVTRPAGGFLADYIYAKAPQGKGVHFKKFWYMFLVFMQGVFLLWIGLTGPRLNPVGLVGGICAMAVFMDAANGAAYSLVPHVNPEINGIMSGLVGGSGNLGGVGWSIGYRFAGGYATGTWIIGVGSMAIALLCLVIPTLSKKQRAGGGYMAQ